MFAETLRDLRVSRGMTQRELAEKLGVRLRTVQYYENGDHIPKDINVLNRIAAIFDVPVHTLVDSTQFYRMLRAEEPVAGRTSDRKELYRILQELTSLFAGGTLSESDRELFLEAVTELVRETDD